MNNKKSEKDKWQEFVLSEFKSNSKLGKILESSQFGSYDNSVLTIRFPDDNSRKAAQGQIVPIQKKLKDKHQLNCNSIKFEVGSITNHPTPTVNSSTPPKPAARNNNPLQSLYWVEPTIPPENDATQRMSILKETVAAEQGCTQIYTKLNQRTSQLAGEENVIKVSFNWRLRVGGTRGFRELLLPVLHPVFGIPYIPASTLKGATSAWARKNDTPQRVKELLGMLDGKDAKAAKVQFLDAFPSKPCLSVDVATPQWFWREGKVLYKPEPHPLLSLEQPQFLIGLCPTSKKNPDTIQDDIKLVKSWLENALNTGIGSRVSSGYGQALGRVSPSNTRRGYDFELWTQGMYGSNPPSKENHYQGTSEFRSSAVRGILRYWFRAVGLGLYDVPTCQGLEEKIFGNLGKQGQISISSKVNPLSKRNPDLYTGKIYLEATETKYLNLAEKLLFLAVQLGGVGRGSRRPLHLLNDRMRGCHWELVNNLPLTYDAEKWRKFFTELKQAFQAIQASTGSYVVTPGIPRNRQQDVLDSKAQVWLLKSPSQIHPQKVVNWQNEGSNSRVRGTALDLLYSDNSFKGQSQGKGNANVGGALETPSFVWIKSVFTDTLAYQVVTIFGTDHPERKKFAQALKDEGAILVTK